jgi:hypothetical protein
VTHSSPFSSASRDRHSRPDSATYRTTEMKWHSPRYHRKINQRVLSLITFEVDPTHLTYNRCQVEKPLRSSSDTYRGLEERGQSSTRNNSSANQISSHSRYLSLATGSGEWQGDVLKRVGRAESVPIAAYNCRMDYLGLTRHDNFFKVF